MPDPTKVAIKAADKVFNSADFRNSLCLRGRLARDESWGETPRRQAGRLTHYHAVHGKAGRAMNRNSLPGPFVVFGWVADDVLEGLFQVGKGGFSAALKILPLVRSAVLELFEFIGGYLLFLLELSERVVPFGFGPVAGSNGFAFQFRESFFEVGHLVCQFFLQLLLLLDEIGFGGRHGVFGVLFQLFHATGGAG